MLKTAIPFVDLRGKTPVELLRAYPDKSRALVAAARSTYGLWSQAASLAALPLADRRSRAWLKRNRNPYFYEIETFAGIVECPGIYALNLSYEWGCTTGVYPNDESVTLLRVLDWPFPALGEHVMVVLQQGKAGEFYNITWPGMAGVYTAMAPGRFSAALNQAPIRSHGKGRGGDWFKNRLLVHREKALPPAHLLRWVFEQAASYDEAKLMLSTMPVAMPVIYVLGGIGAGQGCVIERLENSAEIIELGAGQQASASNHFNSKLADVGKGWRNRREDSPSRHKQSCAIHGHDLQAAHFDWLQAPMVNQYTRLCVLADAATRRLSVQGFAGMTQVTEVFHLAPENYARQAV